MLLLLVQNSNSAVPYAVDVQHVDETLRNQTVVLDAVVVMGALIQTTRMDRTVGEPAEDSAW